MPTVAFKTLGCRLNQAETDLLAEDLLALGFEVVAESDDPDVVVINTCTVTAEASSGSRRTATKAYAANPDALVVVAGCYAVAEPAEAAAIPGVSIVASNDQKASLAADIAAKLASRGKLGPAKTGSPITGPSLDRPTQPLLQLGKRSGFPGADRVRVNLKVQTGCDEFCTFCIIPFTRGPLKSDPLDEIIATARRKVAEGTRELVLTGVHLGKFGWDEGRPDGLISMLHRLLEIDDLSRIRLSSLLSRHVTDDLIDLMRSEPRICRFLHVPLQAGDDVVLEQMNRPYRIADLLERVESARERIDGLALSTDVIVGFPGETDVQFDRTVEIVERLRFMKLHVFRYSPRAGTPSAIRKDQVPEAVKKARSKRLIAVGNELRKQFNDRWVGQSVEVLAEQRFDSGDLIGHTDNFLTVKFAGDAGLVDKLCLVDVISSAVDSVRGDLVRELDWSEARPHRRCYPDMSTDGGTER